MPYFIVTLFDLFFTDALHPMLLLKLTETMKELLKIVICSSKREQI